MSKFFDLPNGDMINLDIVAAVVFGESDAGLYGHPLRPRVIIDTLPVRDDLRGTHEGRTHLIYFETDEAAIAYRDEIKAAVRARETFQSPPRGE